MRARVDLVIVGPEGPLAAGVADVAARSRASRWSGRRRPRRGWRPPRASPRRSATPPGVPTAAWARFEEEGGGARACPGGRRADRGQGRRARGRQGRDRREYGGGGRGGRPRRPGRRVRRGRRLGGDRGVHDRRGGVALRPVRRGGGAPHRHGAGPQARLRRRRGAEHRRYGRLLPRAGPVGRCRGARDAGDRAPDPAGDGPPRDTVFGRALCGADDRGGRSAPGGVELPPRRSRGAGPRDAGSARRSSTSCWPAPKEGSRARAGALGRRPRPLRRPSRRAGIPGRTSKGRRSAGWRRFRKTARR